MSWNSLLAATCASHPSQCHGWRVPPAVRFVEGCHVLRATAAAFRGVQRHDDEPLEAVRVEMTWEDGRPTESIVAVVTTRLRSGGLRYWFGCPYCRCRVGCLYTPSRDAPFRCRTCWDLQYLSQYRRSGAALSEEAPLRLLGWGIGPGRLRSARMDRQPP